VIATLEYLRRALYHKNLVVFCGAGVSTAAAGLPSWPRFLDDAVEYVREHYGSRQNLQKLRAAQQLAKSGQLPHAFEVIQTCLAEPDRAPFESVHYEAFLSDSFRNATVNSSALLQALRGLDSRLFVTTNYDNLLEQHVVGRLGGSATWLNPVSIRSMIRSGSGVVHLHGRFDIPRSIILSTSDYQRIVDERDSNAIAEALFHSGVLLFVGTSLDGMGDPHLTRLLNSFARLTDPALGEENPHVALLPGRIEGDTVARLRRQGIDVCSYGDAYEDLPQFIRSIVVPDAIQVGLGAVRSKIEAATRASNLGEAIATVSDFIKSVVFPGREVRITFTELREDDAGDRQLEARYVFPPNPTRNVFNYPLSIAAWSLVEGRIISWPSDADDVCNVGLVDNLGRLVRARLLLDRDYTVNSPEIRRYVDIAFVRRAMDNRTLRLRDFFQDWDSVQPRPRYGQFLSVPVPIVENFGNRETVAEYGVFNIDTGERLPLLDARSEELLKLASAVATLCYVRFSLSYLDTSSGKATGG
jgi:hypothetical protein